MFQSHVGYHQEETQLPDIHMIYAPSYPFLVTVFLPDYGPYTADTSRRLTCTGIEQNYHKCSNDGIRVTDILFFLGGGSTVPLLIFFMKHDVSKAGSAGFFGRESTYSKGSNRAGAFPA